jgi:arginyl-tRNA synthetase
MLDFKSCKSIYLQYTAARILSILKKCENEFGDRQRNSDALIFEETIEYQIAIKAMFFPKMILKAQRTKSPHLIFNYLIELAKRFNKFYGDISVINTQNPKLLASRISLIKSVFIVIRNGLRLLNITIPEKM